MTRVVVAAVAILGVLATPASALAHGLATAYQSQLPLAVYLTGAAAAVVWSLGQAIVVEPTDDAGVSMAPAVYVVRPS